MDLTPKQQKRLDRLSKSSNQLEANIAILSSFGDVEDELEDKVEELSENLDSIKSEVMSELDTIKQSIGAIEIPEQKDHTEHMQKMMDLINEPEEIVVKLNIV